MDVINMQTDITQEVPDKLMNNKSISGQLFIKKTTGKQSAMR